MSIIIVVPPQTEATDPVKKSSLLSILFVPSRKFNLTPESIPGISIWAFESIISGFGYFSLSSFSSIPVSLITFDDIFQFFPI